MMSFMMCLFIGFNLGSGHSKRDAVCAVFVRDAKRPMTSRAHLAHDQLVAMHCKVPTQMILIGRFVEVLAHRNSVTYLVAYVSHLQVVKEALS